jgi:hypothetical protein
MIAINIVLMALVVVGIVSLLAWAIVSDRRSHRAAGDQLPLSPAPLHRNLVMPRELRPHRHAGGRTHATRGRQGVRGSSPA